MHSKDRTRTSTRNVIVLKTYLLLNTPFQLRKTVVANKVQIVVNETKKLASWPIMLGWKNNNAEQW